MKKFLLSLAATLLAFPTFAQQTPTYQENIDVNVVLVDATVTDSRGNQILGLGKDDFIVKENGVPQEISSVDYFTNRRLLTTPESQAAFKVEQVKEDRYFVLFIDKTFQHGGRNVQGDLMRLRSSVDKFIDTQMLPQDYLAILGYDSRLKVYADFSKDKAALHKAMSDAIQFSQGITTVPANASDPSILKHIDMKKMIDHTGRIYDALELVGKAVRPIAARKNLLLVSPGVWDYDRLDDPFWDVDFAYYNPMMQTLNGANVTVYAMNLLNNVQYAQAEHTLGRLTADTGGEFFRFPVNFDTPLKRVENVSNGYYLISYTSKKAREKSGYQPIDVSLRNPEFRLTARQGYSY